jgi:heat shock protein HslJ
LRYLQNNVGIRRASNIPITLNFNIDRTVEGSTGCGAFAAHYWVRHNAMGITDAPGLPEECAPSPWSLLERDYYAALSSVGWNEVDANRLKLTSGDDTTLVFEPVGPKCESPKPVLGDSAPTPTLPWPALHVLLTSDDPIEPLIQQLEMEYPDLELRAANECGPDQITVAVNRVTLEYLRCRSDISTITYQ